MEGFFQEQYALHMSHLLLAGTSGWPNEDVPRIPWFQLPSMSEKSLANMQCPTNSLASECWLEKHILLKCCSLFKWHVNCYIVHVSCYFSWGGGWKLGQPDCYHQGWAYHWHIKMGRTPPKRRFTKLMPSGPTRKKPQAVRPKGRRAGQNKKGLEWTMRPVGGRQLEGTSVLCLEAFC